MSAKTVHEALDYYASLGRNIKEHERLLDFAPKVGSVPIVWDTRRSKTAGRAHLTPKMELHLNIILATNPDWEWSTFCHELAHLFAWVLFQDPGHGPCWVRVAQRLGHTGNRCHSYNLPGRIAASKKEKGMGYKGTKAKVLADVTAEVQRHLSEKN